MKITKKLNYTLRISTIVAVTLIISLLFPYLLGENKAVEQLKSEYSSFEKQWGLYNDGQEINGQKGITGIDINILKAWSLTRGSDDVIVGVLDSGIDNNHEAIENNIYINAAEIRDNDIDDDSNGYIDDINGWNFYNDKNIVYEGLLQDYHGTHIAGIIAASNDNGVVCGVAPDVSILPLRFLRGSKGQISDAINAIQYAYSLGVRIINCSWDSAEYYEELFYAMEKYNEILFVCSAGKDNKDLSVRPVYPACFDLPNVICVAAIDNQGNLEKYTNYGKEVHVAAPGVDIYSCMPDGEYSYLSGTSSAAAYVTGIAALVKSCNPDLTCTEISNILQIGVKTLPALDGKVKSGGIIDAFLCLKEAKEYLKHN